jgi:hypothetical protein
MIQRTPACETPGHYRAWPLKLGRKAQFGVSASVGNQRLSPLTALLCFCTFVTVQILGRVRDLIHCWFLRPLTHSESQAVLTYMRAW